MIEVFITDVGTPTDAIFLNEKFREEFPGIDFHFDLEDCDRILRAESGNSEIQAVKIIHCLNRWGFRCEVLNDSPSENQNIEKNQSHVSDSGFRQHHCP